MLLLPTPGELQISNVPAEAAPPNRAGMPATRVDTNKHNHIVRNFANVCMKYSPVSNLPYIGGRSKQMPTA
jgi:hypothetical protein